MIISNSMYIQARRMRTSKFVCFLITQTCVISDYRAMELWSADFSLELDKLTFMIRPPVLPFAVY